MFEFLRIFRIQSRKIPLNFEHRCSCQPTVQPCQTSPTHHRGRQGTGERAGRPRQYRGEGPPRVRGFRGKPNGRHAIGVGPGRGGSEGWGAPPTQYWGRWRSVNGTNDEDSQRRGEGNFLPQKQQTSTIPNHVYWVVLLRGNPKGLSEEMRLYFERPFLNPRGNDFLVSFLQ